MRDPQKQRIYNSWRNIQQTVNNPNNSGYMAHQRQGLDIGNDFEGWAEFYEYVMTKLGPQPNPEYRLIRKNQTKSYGPKNLMWGTAEDMGDRFIHATHIKFMGNNYTVNRWARVFNVHPATLMAQVRKSKKPTDALAQYV